MGIQNVHVKPAKDIDTSIVVDYVVGLSPYGMIIE